VTDATASETYERTGAPPLYAFSVNDCDTVCAESADDARAWYIEHLGDESAVEDIVTRDLNGTMRLDEDSTERITMREAIARAIADGDTIPFLLCSTEY
jgi:hypothetical protein